MVLDEKLAAFDREVRQEPVPGPGLRVVHEGKLVRLAGRFHFVSFWVLDPTDARAAVDEIARRFRARAETVIWRVHGHDKPAGLAAHLATAGFVPDPPGTLLFLDGDCVHLSSDAGAVQVRRVRTRLELDDFLGAAARAFDSDPGAGLRDVDAGDLQRPDWQLFVAYIDGLPVASARLEISRSFGLLYGGGVIPAQRRRGVYRALVAARVAAALRGGAKTIATEARETSRPILERLGFRAATTETTWVLRNRSRSGQGS